MMRQHIAAFLAAFAACALAEFKLDNVFSSNMVLQQQTPISFFGTSKATDKISATFNGRTVDAVPDEKGDWRVTFPAMEASDENISATFSDGKNTVVLKDILIGEVWFCSGQSNMAMPIQKKPVTNWSAMDCEKVVAEANYPAIRYAYQAHTINKLRKLPATYHRDLPNGWVKCSPDTAHHFGAAAYFFGLELYKQYNVPIGLINASWGGTRIQPWISREGHLNAGLLSDVAAIDRQTMDDKAIEAATNAEYKRFAKDFSEWHKKFEAAYSEAKAASAEWSKPDFDDSSWGAPTHLKSAKCHVIWSRCTF